MFVLVLYFSLADFSEKTIAGLESDDHFGVTRHVRIVAVDAVVL